MSSTGLIEAAESKLVGPVQKRMRSFEDRSLLVPVIAASLALAWILLPFYGAILWGVVGAIVFAPLDRPMTTSGSVGRLGAFNCGAVGYACCLLTGHPIIFAEQRALSRAR